MIYTITFNPAIDLVVKVPNCELGTLKPFCRKKTTWQVEKALICLSS